MAFKIGDIVMRFDGDGRPHKIVDITVHYPLNSRERTFFQYHYEDGGSDISDGRYIVPYDGKYKRNKVMKANEIQIRDLLYYKGQFNAFPFKVESITKKKVGYHAEPNEHRVYYLRLSECKPIPLTPEILEKNGFKLYIPENHLETVYACQDISKAVANELYALWPYQDGSFYLLLRVDGKDMVRIDVHYIHQLQHALRLCGIEKEIIL